MTEHPLASARQRRTYSHDFKSEVVAQCSQTGNSVAGVALRYGINTNLMHKWLRHAKSASRQIGGVPSAFIPLVLGSSPTPHPGATIQIAARRGDMALTVSWPVQDSHACVALLTEWLR